MRSGYDNPADGTTALVLARATTDEGIRVCEVCGDPIFGDRGWDWSLHHRRGRDGKPDSHQPQNLLLVHGRDNVSSCHGRIHRNREGESRTKGWLISRNGIVTDPLVVPALLCGESAWVHLGEDGRYEDSPPERVA